VFGPDFEPGWIILVIGTVGQLVNCGTGSVGYLLLMSGNEKRLVRIQMVMAVVTVLLCMALVSRFGFTGAAVATAACSIMTNFWCLVEVRRNLGLFPYNRSYWILAVPSLVTIAVGLGLRTGLRSVHADIPVLVLSTAVVYILFLGTVLLMGLEAEDRMIASAIWARVRGGFPVLRGSAS
jgi:O-antigen/teichoic acid export membrane protein